MKRKIMEKLLQWRNQRTDRMPMLLYGARQVGKTFVMRELAAVGFQNTVYVNFEEDQRIGEYFRGNIKADEALRIGLVNAVYPQEELLPAAEKMAAGIAKNAPIAVRNCKKAINDGLDVNMDEAIVIEEKLFGDCFETEDQKYGMAFFLDKNKEKVKEPFRNK